jgi:hypothetical protein
VAGYFWDSMSVQGKILHRKTNFPSNKAEIANKMARLKILETWLGYIYCQFLNIKDKIEKETKFRR